MDIIEQLIAQHRINSESIDVLRKVHTMVETEGVFLEDIERLRRFFQKEMREHIRLEEEVFFPVARRCFSSEKVAVIDELKSDHPHMIKALDYFDKAAQAYETAITVQSRQNLRDVSRVIIETVIDHAQKEDRELFSVVGECFHEKEYKELEEAYFRFIQKK
jgi:iron-sulfur cluster repair protein YtfE (RIC family)